MSFVADVITISCSKTNVNNFLKIFSITFFVPLYYSNNTIFLISPDPQSERLFDYGKIQKYRGFAPMGVD